MIPKLRFPEFEGELKLKKLGDVTTWASGGTPPKDKSSYWNGDIPWISASSMRGLEYSDSNLKITEEGLNAGSKLAPKDSILILVRGSMLFNKIPIGIATRDVAFNQDVKSLIVNNEVITKYILYWFFHKERKILNKVTGTGIGAGKLDMSDLKALKISIPPNPEQTKIATFLTAIDKRINLLQKKKAELEQYKKGIMQKLFSQEIRFKKDDGSDFPDWEEKKLGEVLNYLQPTKYLVSDTEYKDEYETPVLTAGKTFILGYTNEIEGIFSENLPIIIFDDFTTAFKFVDFPFKAKSSAMKMLIPANENVNIMFVFEVMKTIKFPLAEHKRYWISEYQNEKISYPHKDEQQKIANFLSSIDKSIESIGKQIEASKEWKQGLLQKMFV